MIIGYDAKRAFRNGTGLGAYCRTLLTDIAQQADSNTMMLLYTPDHGRDEYRSQMEQLPYSMIRYPRKWRGVLGKAIWRSYGMVRDLEKDQVDIFHGLSGELPMGIARHGIKTVVTIHDLIFLRHPEFYHWVDAKIYAAKFYATCREAHRIIAISECTKRDIMYYGGVDEDKIDVIYQSCCTRFTEPATEESKRQAIAKYMLPKRYIIHVGTIEQRKNILQAVEALPQVPSDVHLVVVGKSTPYADKVKAYVAAHGLEQRVHFFHGVSSEDLPALYQLAEACVYPSVYEGFGIPVIEAIQSGLPVVACSGSCLEEAGGPDSLYVAPGDVAGMGVALCRVLKGADGREERIRRSKEYVTRFENTGVARQMLQVYERLLKEQS